MHSHDTNLVKVVLVGKTEVGKTSLNQRFIREEFNHYYQKTLGLKFKTKIAEIDASRLIKFHLWEKGEDENSSQIHSVLYNEAHAVVICCDLTSRDSFNGLIADLEETASYAPKAFVYLVGTKTDLRDQHQVTEKELRALAEQHERKCYCMFTSAATGAGVKELFFDIAFKSLHGIYLQYMQAFEQTKRQTIELNRAFSLRTNRDIIDELQKLSDFIDNLKVVIETYEVTQDHIAKYRKLVSGYQGSGISAENLQGIKNQRRLIDHALNTLQYNLIALDRSLMSGWQRLIDIVAIFIGTIVGAIGAGLGGFFVGTVSPAGPYAGGVIGAGIFGTAGALLGKKVAHQLVTKGIFAYNHNQTIKNQLPNQEISIANAAGKDTSIHQQLSCFSVSINESLSRSRMTANDIEMRNKTLDNQLSTLHKLTR